MRAALRRVLPRSWSDRFFWLLVVTVFFGLVWQAADRVPAFVVTHRELLTPTVKAGELLQIRYAGKQNWQGENKVYRRVYDGASVLIPHLTEENPPRPMKEIYTSSVRIPRYATPGKARMIVTVCWERQFNIVHQMWPVCPPSGDFEFEITE